MSVERSAFFLSDGLRVYFLACALCSFPSFNVSLLLLSLRFASLKALQAPLEDIDRAFLSQFISIMRRDGMQVYIIARVCGFLWMSLVVSIIDYSVGKC